MKIEQHYFGQWQGTDFHEIFLTNRHGITVSFLPLGARINRWLVPQADGSQSSMILGYRSMTQFEQGGNYRYGATIGRVAGRIANGQFNLAGQTYHLDKNDGAHHLHGGTFGLDDRLWEVSIQDEGDLGRVVFTYQEVKNISGYPGSLSVQVIHEWDDNNCWTCRTQAFVSQPTPLNLTNHVYFNLNGRVDQPITNHSLSIDADRYVPVDAEAIPLGELAEVDGTAFDFRQSRHLGDSLDQEDQQLQLMQGLDHPFVLNSNGDRPQIQLTHPDGLGVAITSDQPAAVIYTHNTVDVPLIIDGNSLVPRAGIAIELQQIPDAINQPQFGDCVVAPGQIYTSQTRYQLTNFHPSSL